MVTVQWEELIYLTKKPLLMDYVKKKFNIYQIPGYFNSKDALRIRLAREIGGWKMVKLEILEIKNSISRYDRNYKNY